MKYNRAGVQAGCTTFRPQGEDTEPVGDTVLRTVPPSGIKREGVVGIKPEIVQIMRACLARIREILAIRTGIDMRVYRPETWVTVFPNL
mgnify:CR=1 FL=1